MPRKTRVCTRKTRRSKATRRRTNRARRMRGGVGVTSCPAGSVHILEDGLETAGPEQIICYGDSLTSCTSVTVVMEDNWKIGTHMNSPSYVAHVRGNTTAPAQRVNPETIIPLLKYKLENDENFRGKKIKAIYVVGEAKSFHIYEKNYDFIMMEGEGYNAVLNNGYSQEIRPTTRVLTENEQHNPLTANVKAPLDMGNINNFFRNQFGDRFVDTPVFQILANKNIQAVNGGHFLIQADGTLDIS